MRATKQKTVQQNEVQITVRKHKHKANVNTDNLVGYKYENEHGRDVEVISVEADWCMVKEFAQCKPYIVEKSFVMEIKKLSKG
jgi:hypothetical protein